MEGSLTVDQQDSGAGLSKSKHGSPTFYSLLEEIAETHDRKSHDYASNESPYGNYHFAGYLATLFSHSYHDAGFVGRIGEKIYRLANLEKSGKEPNNESIEDTERDIAVITVLWMADRRDRRGGKDLKQNALQKELYDLIYLMPDFQREDLHRYLAELLQTKQDRIVDLAKGMIQE